MSTQTGQRGTFIDSTATGRSLRKTDTAALPPMRLEARKRDPRLTALTGLASVTIETSMAANLSGSLHSLFDDICDKTLPIYFGPLLGRLYLEGL